MTENVEKKRLKLLKSVIKEGMLLSPYRNERIIKDEELCVNKLDHQGGMDQSIEHSETKSKKK